MSLASFLGKSKGALVASLGAISPVTVTPTHIHAALRLATATVALSSLTVSVGARGGQSGRGFLNAQEAVASLRKYKYDTDFRLAARITNSHTTRKFTDIEIEITRNVILDLLVLNDSNKRSCEIQIRSGLSRGISLANAAERCNNNSLSDAIKCSTLLIRTKQTSDLFNYIADIYNDGRMKINREDIEKWKFKNSCDLSVDDDIEDKRVAQFEPYIADTISKLYNISKGRDIRKLTPEDPILKEWRASHSQVDWTSFGHALIYSCLSSRESEFHPLLAVQCAAGGIS